MLSVSARLKGLSLSPLIERWLLFRMWADGFIWSRRPRKRNVTIIFVVGKILINCITRTCLICASKTPPRMASCWPVTPLIIFIFMCSHVITLLPEGKKKTSFILDNTLFLCLFLWFQPANTCTETASPPPLSPQNGFLPVCLCVAADNVPPCIFVSVCFSQKHRFWEMTGVLPALCTLASSHFCLCGDFHRPAVCPNPNPHI